MPSPRVVFRGLGLSPQGSPGIGTFSVLPRPDIGHWPHATSQLLMSWPILSPSHAGTLHQNPLGGPLRRTGRDPCWGCAVGNIPSRAANNKLSRPSSLDPPAVATNLEMQQPSSKLSSRPSNCSTSNSQGWPITLLFLKLRRQPQGARVPLPPGNIRHRSVSALIKSGNRHNPSSPTAPWLGGVAAAKR
jgi:hypothetical protein